MRTLAHRARPAGLFVILAMIAAACGGTTASGPSGALPTGAAPTTGATQPASVAPATVAPTAGAASTEPSSAVAIPTFDLSKLGGAIPGLDSYRVAVTTDGTKQYESTVVTKPELAKHITTFDDDGSVDDEFIIVGDTAWEKDDGKWQEIPSQLGKAMLMALDPSTMFAAYASANWSGAATQVGHEDKNGIPSTHYSIDPSRVIIAGVPAGTTIDLWVADAGHLVALEIVSGGVTQLGIEVSDVNDPANVVERPTS